MRWWRQQPEEEPPQEVPRTTSKSDKSNPARWSKWVGQSKQKTHWVIEGPVPEMGFGGFRNSDAGKVNGSSAGGEQDAAVTAFSQSYRNNHPVSSLRIDD